MRYKKQIVSIMTLTILLLLMMSTVMQAVSLVESIGDFKAVMNGSQMKLTWASVSNSAGYNVYVNGTKIGSVNSNEASLIGFTENTTYRLRVTAYDHAKMEVATSNEINFTTTTNQTNLGQVQNLTVTQANGYVTLNWSSVNNANKYQVFVDVPGFGNINIGEVTTTNAMLKGFSNGMRYGFSVRACQTLNADNVSYGAKSVAQYITIDFNKDDTNNDNNIPERPDKVKDVTIYDVTETTATVTWKEVSNAEGYDVLVSKNYGSYQTVISKTGNRTVLSNLTPDSYYRVKIVAYKKINNEKVYGEESSYSAFNTKEEKIAVGDINQIDVYDITTTTARISWSKANNADGYEVLLSKNNGRYETIYDTTNRVVALSNLTADSSYRVKIIAYKWVSGRKQYGNESYSYKFNTKEEKITVGDINQIDVYDITTTTARISWSKANNADGYEVLLSKNNGRYETIYDTTNRVVALSNLTADSSYRVKIVAYKWVSGRKQYGNESYSYKFNTKEEKVTVDKVRTIYVDSLTKNSARISWSAVSNATGYYIYLDQGNGRYQYQGLTTNRSYAFSNLKANTYYQVKIQAYKKVNGKEYISDSTIKGFTTEKEPTTTIKTVTGLRASVRNTTVTLSWNKVTDAAGYEIDFSVPGIGHIPYYANSNSTSISGVTGKSKEYTARVRAYKYVNGVKKYGAYSEIVRFKGN